MSSTEDSKNRKVHDSVPCILVCYYIFLQLCKLAVPYFCSPHGNFWAGDARLGLFAGWCWCWFGLVGAGFLWEKNTVGWLVWAGWNQQANRLIMDKPCGNGPIALHAYFTCKDWHNSCWYDLEKSNAAKSIPRLSCRGMWIIMRSWDRSVMELYIWC